MKADMGKKRENDKENEKNTGGGKDKNQKEQKQR